MGDACVESVVWRVWCGECGVESVVGSRHHIFYKLHSDPSCRCLSPVSVSRSAENNVPPGQYAKSVACVSVLQSNRSTFEQSSFKEYFLIADTQIMSGQSKQTGFPPRKKLCLKK